MSLEPQVDTYCPFQSYQPVRNDDRRTFATVIWYPFGPRIDDATEAVPEQGVSFRVTDRSLQSSDPSHPGYPTRSFTIPYSSTYRLEGLSLWRHRGQSSSRLWSLQSSSTTLLRPYSIGDGTRPSQALVTRIY